MSLENFQIVKIDKFVFHVKNDLFYDKSHLWYKLTGKQGMLGISDYLQQTVGDIAFITVFHTGEHIDPNQTVIELESMKVTLELTLPFPVTILEENKELELKPEIVNTDPYGIGWIAKFELTNLEEFNKNVMNAHSYVEFMKGEAEKNS